MKRAAKFIDEIFLAIISPGGLTAAGISFVFSELGLSYKMGVGVFLLYLGIAQTVREIRR